jgi:hypothetical protein
MQTLLILPPGIDSKKVAVFDLEFLGPGDGDIVCWYVAEQGTHELQGLCHLVTRVNWVKDKK